MNNADLISCEARNVRIAAKSESVYSIVNSLDENVAIYLVRYGLRVRLRVGVKE